MASAAELSKVVRIQIYLSPIAMPSITKIVAQTCWVYSAWSLKADKRQPKCGLA
jgi:hypothetical protein